MNPKQITTLVPNVIANGILDSLQVGMACVPIPIPRFLDIGVCVVGFAGITPERFSLEMPKTPSMVGA